MPRTGETATRLGVGAMLGGDLIGRDTGDGVTIPPLPRVPLSARLASRSSPRIVILNPARAAVALAGVVIDAVDNKHAAELRRALRVPAPDRPRPSSRKACRMTLITTTRPGDLPDYLG